MCDGEGRFAGRDFSFGYEEACPACHGMGLIEYDTRPAKAA